MSKYIDADLLREKLIERLGLFEELTSDTISPIRIDECKKIIGIIDLLQQEQPEVDLEKEIKKVVIDMTYEYFPEQDGDIFSDVDFGKCLKRVARHFYELGLNTRCEK